MTRSRDPEVEALASQLDQRYSPGPRKIADVVASLMARRGYGEVEAVRERREAWRTAVGAPLANETRADRVRRGVLDVTVRNSSVLQELSLQKKKLVEQMKKLAPAQRIRDLRFRVGPVD